MLAGGALVLALNGAGNDYVAAARGRQSVPPKPGQPPAQQQGRGGSGDPRDQRPQRKPFWQDEVIKKEIALTDQQVQKIQALSDAAKPEFDKYREEFTKEQKELDRLMSIRAEDVTVMMQIDRVEALRTVLNKRQTLLRYRIHKVLSPQQDARLKAITNPDNGRRGGPPR